MRNTFKLIVPVLLFSLTGTTRLDACTGKPNEFNFPALEGFEINYDYPVYTPANLWDYINGAADAYLTYGFSELYIAEYLDGDNAFKAELYVHKDPIYAFGMYAVERSLDYNFMELGVQGYSEASHVHFVKGKYYIKLKTNATGKNTEKLLMKIASLIEAELKGETTMPVMFSIFPEEGRQADTEYFVASSFLGYSFLNEVYSCKYSIDDKSFTAFIIGGDNEALLKDLKGKALDAGFSKGMHIIKDRYNGTLYIRESGDMLIGTLNLEDKPVAVEFLKQVGDQ